MAGRKTIQQRIKSSGDKAVPPQLRSIGSAGERAGSSAR
jgi:hypothetical protein